MRSGILSVLPMRFDSILSRSKVSGLTACTPSPKSTELGERRLKFVSPQAFPVSHHSGFLPMTVCRVKAQKAPSRVSAAHSRSSSLSTAIFPESSEACPDLRIMSSGSKKLFS